MNEKQVLIDTAQQVWATKYRFCPERRRCEASIEETWRRVAAALAAVEARDAARWRERFFDLLTDFKFLPGGRILAGAGTGRCVTLFNCFVMGCIEDSMDGIFDALKEGARTMQMGGGVGYDFSTLRPRGMPARRVGSMASGPVSFMHIWDSMCATVLSTGYRRGAMMGTLRCDHPDIEEFVSAKQERTALRHFNLSVLVSDAFITAMQSDLLWPLIFPDETATGETCVMENWPGHDMPVKCRVFKRVRARDLWDRIMRSAYEYAEPGVLFIDRINRLNNLHYCERINAVNPCGEIPLPPYGACNLGSFNLTRFICDPFTDRARPDLDAIATCVRVAVRLLDNAIDCSKFPLPQQRERASATRRIGLGITGLADALIMLGRSYGEPSGRTMAARMMATTCHSAYRASIELAQEKGTFPLFRQEAYLRSPFIASLPEDVRRGIERYGLRNSHLTAIAPAGTISLLAGNVSSGIEPVFEGSYSRRMITEGGEREFRVEDDAVRRWRALGRTGLPPAFVDVRGLAPKAHLEMQAVLQPFVDNAISKTVNVPEGCDFESFKSLYTEAYTMGLKGCAAFRPNPVTGAVLESCAPCENYSGRRTDGTSPAK